MTIAACSHRTYYDPESGYGRAYFDEIRRACDQSKYYCEDLIEKARLAHHRCRSTDGIKKQQQKYEIVVNDTIVGSVLRTEWNVWDGSDKNSCYSFVSFDDRKYNVKEKFISSELGKPYDEKTFVQKIIIYDESIVTPKYRNQIRDFYNAIHKKDEFRPPKTKGKYEFYERKYLNEEPLFSINEVIQEKIPINNYFAGEKITDQDVKNFASGLYSIENNSIKISKENQERVLAQIEKDQDEKNRQCWFEEYEDMSLCHSDFFKSNSFVGRREFREKYGQKAIFSKKYRTETFIDYPKVMVNGVMMRKGINFKDADKYKVTKTFEFLEVEYFCKNSTISDKIKIKKHGRVKRADRLPENYCMLPI